MKPKKHLSFSSLRKMFSHQTTKFIDKRQSVKTDYTLHDTVMSGFACMFFQDPSMLQFQQRMQNAKHNNNFATLFGVQKIPSANQIKDLLDTIDPASFTPVFKEIIHRLQRGKHLEGFQFIPGWTVCSIDGTQYFSSKSIHCKKCLTKKHDDSVIYQHHALQSALMHPNHKQVFPLLAEPIQNSDGNRKQDCEINAGKRLIANLKKEYPKMGLIITGDDLFSRQPMIECVREKGFNFFFVAKPKSHKYLWEWVNDYKELPEIRIITKNGNVLLYQWMNNVPLHGGDKSIHVNYFQLKKIRINAEGKEEVYSTQAWVTDFEITKDLVVTFVQGGKSRWKIENECFNTLKNQGYHLEHNYGHGEENLSYNFYLLTLLAFLFHQVFELCDYWFQTCRKHFVSKVNLWHHLRTSVRMFIFEEWEELLELTYDPDSFETHWKKQGASP
jgi:hypothetical protein